MLETLFNPKSIALIGASRNPGKIGYDILDNLISGGFAGDIIPVNPTADQILNIPCYKNVLNYGQPVDLSIIAIPGPQVKEAVEGSIKAGAKSIIIVSSGFKEIGVEGADLEKQIVELCAHHGVHLLGPNCLGIINTECRMNATFAGEMPEAGCISVISQSGALCAAILDLFAVRHLGLAKLISIGNKADLTEVDFLRVLAKDNQTKVIIGYLENISNPGDDFVKAAEEASMLKPVVLLKSGTTSAGIKAASSHTGAISTSDTAYAAAFKRAGVIRSDTFDSLFDYAIALSLQPLPKGDNVLIITNAGGPGTMAADAVEKSGLKVATLQRNVATALRGKLPAAANVGNPIDVLGDADPTRYVSALELAQDDDKVDAIIIILSPQAMTKPAETARAIASSLKGDKPVYAAFMGGKKVLPGREELTAMGLPWYDSPERAVTALKGIYQYAKWKQRPRRVVTRFRVNRRRVERIISRSLREQCFQLNEVKAKDILRAYGFVTPEGSLVRTSEEAIEVALRVGFPVAMKIVSADIIHKTDLGGVRLNIANVDEVQDAFDLMMLRIKQRVPKAIIDGIYVESMIDRGVEVIIGMSRDPNFGSILMFGLGGIFVEAMKDVAFNLAPIAKEDAMQMLKATRSYEILKGKRGEKGVDLDAIAIGLQRISQLAMEFPEIDELDINPYIIKERGKEPFVADARMTLKA